MRCVKFLLGADAKNNMTGGAFSRKATMAKCTRDDMMKLIWLRAQKEDIDIMNQMFDLHITMGARAKTPPLLPRKKRTQLLENFNFLDRHQEGVIKYEDLVVGGLID